MDGLIKQLEKDIMNCVNIHDHNRISKALNTLEVLKNTIDYAHSCTKLKGKEKTVFDKYIKDNRFEIYTNYFCELGENWYKDEVIKRIAEELDSI